jgi:hypothetical protein
VLRRSWGTHDIICYYTTSAAALVGVVKNDDVSDLCGGMSSVEIAGDFPSSAACAVNLLPTVKVCP